MLVPGQPVEEGRGLVARALGPVDHGQEHQHAVGRDRRQPRLGGQAGREQADGGNTSNWVGEVNLTRRLETIRLLGQYRRVVSGTGSGTLTQRDQVTVAFTRQLSELLSAGLGALAYRTSSVEDNVDFDERNYVQLQARFNWTLTRTLNLEANYRYTVIDREDENEAANSNAVTVWLHYRPNPISVSR